ncbi:hypothetical protein CR513_62197, partial [Mucuna pruriens]
MILRKEFKLIAGNLRSKWDGPFVITNVFPYDIVEIRNKAIDMILRQLKTFHESPTMVKGDVEDLSLIKSTFPKIRYYKIVSLRYLTQ